MGGEGAFGSVPRQSLTAVLALLLGFTACDPSIDSLGASIHHNIKPLIFAIENKLINGVCSTDCHKAVRFLPSSWGTGKREEEGLPFL